MAVQHFDDGATFGPADAFGVYPFRIDADGVAYLAGFRVGPINELAQYAFSMDDDCFMTGGGVENGDGTNTGTIWMLRSNGEMSCQAGTGVPSSEEHENDTGNGAWTLTPQGHWTNSGGADFYANGTTWSPSWNGLLFTRFTSLDDRATLTIDHGKHVTFHSSYTNY